MVRNYKRKTERGNVTEDTMKEAVREIRINHRKIREVATEYNIPRKTLGRYYQKFKTIACADSQANGSNMTTTSGWDTFGYAKRFQVFHSIVVY